MVTACINEESTDIQNVTYNIKYKPVGAMNVSDNQIDWDDNVGDVCRTVNFRRCNEKDNAYDDVENVDVSQ